MAESRRSPRPSAPPSDVRSPPTPRKPKAKPSENSVAATPSKPVEPKPPAVVKSEPKKAPPPTAKKEPTSTAKKESPSPKTADTSRRGSDEAKQLVATARQKLRGGNPRGAIVDYRKALKLSPGNLRARYGLAVALYETGQDAKATRMFKAIVASHPNHKGALLKMGAISASRGQRAAARKYYERFLKVSPTGKRADAVRKVLSRL